MVFRCEPLTLLGEGRILKFTRIGDVDLIDLGDGVFTGREPHTSHDWSYEFPRESRSSNK